MHVLALSKPPMSLMFLQIRTAESMDVSKIWAMMMMMMMMRMRVRRMETLMLMIIMMSMVGADAWRCHERRRRRRRCCCDDSNTIPANTSLGTFAACLLGLVSSCIHVS